MPELRNAKHEAFAQAFAKGKSLGQAHDAAGYSKSSRHVANKLKARPDIAMRIAEINAEAAHIARVKLERAARIYDVTTERVITELAKIGFANMQDYLSVGPNGEPHFDYAKITRDQAAAIKEIIIDEYVEGRGDNAKPVKRVRFKLADKRAALVDLGHHLGLFVDPSVINMNVANFFSERPPSLDEWRQEISETVIEAQPTGKPTGVIEPKRKIAR